MVLESVEQRRQFQLMNDEDIIVDTLYEFLGARGHRVLDLHYNFDISYNCYKFVAVVDSNQYLWWGNAWAFATLPKYG